MYIETNTENTKPSDGLSQPQMRNMPRYLKSWRHPQNRKYIRYCSVVRADRATATGNSYKKFHAVWTCSFWDMRVAGNW